MRNALLQTQNLSAFYGSNLIINKVNVQVSRGDLLAIIGPSGCGKSTFLRCLNRLHEEGSNEARVQGDVYLEGENIYGADISPMQIRQKMGMVFQKPTPFPAMSIYENVVIGLKLSGSHKKSYLLEKAEKALRDAVLWEEVADKLFKPGSYLSGGQQQRLCIARAFAMDAPIILLDEPTSALDPIATVKIEELLESLKGKVTFVMVTHNLQQAARISTKTAFFYRGDMVEMSDTKDFFNSPKEIKSQEYLAGRFS